MRGTRDAKTELALAGNRKRKRFIRDAQHLNASPDIAARPADLGATAQQRYTAFKRDGRSESAIRQAADRATRSLLTLLRARLKKGRPDQAAAILGGLLRAPDIRNLLRAAGCILTEDSTVL